MNKFFKDKKNICILILDIVLSIIASLQLKFNSVSVLNIRDIDISLTILCFSLLFLVTAYFMFPTKKYKEYLFEYRFKIGLVLFLILFLGRFNGTSIGMWNYMIQPTDNLSNYTYFGKARTIRSDEWVVNSPIVLSQKYVDFNTNNNLVRGTKTNIYLLTTGTVLDITEIARPLTIAFFINDDYGLSLWWYGRLFLLFFTSFELLFIITKSNRKNSLLGALIITGSSVVQWFFASYITEILVGGQLALIAFYKMLNVKKKSLKVIWSLIMTIGFLEFCLILYPAHQITFGYVFAILAIYLVFTNKEKNKLSEIIKYMIIPAIIIVSVLIRFYITCKEGISYISNTIYPGHRFVTGGGYSEWQRLLQYPYTLFLPFKETGDCCTISSFMTLFPLPILVLLKHLFENKKDIKKDTTIKLLIALLLLFLLYITFCIIGLPSIVVKITLLSKTTVNAICAPIGYICIFILVLLFDKHKTTSIIGKIISFIIAFATSSLCVYVSNSFMPYYLDNKYNIALLILFTLVEYLYLTNDKKWKKDLLFVSLGFMMIVNILCVNPLQKGTSVIYDKPIARVIQKEVNKDKNANWISLNSFITPNYLMMNGAKTINSTNLYPNIELWEKIDKEKKYNEIYNRYAHIVINLCEEETSFNIIQVDLIEINLNYNDLEKIDVNYIYSNSKLENRKDIEFELIYSNDNSYIYKVKYIKGERT